MKNEEVVQPNKAQPDRIIVFDNVASDEQDNIRTFFSMGRHRLIDFSICVKRTHKFRNTRFVIMLIF